MTCREKLAIEHPSKVDEKYIGGCMEHPSTYGYMEDPTWCECNEKTCAQCWDREILVTEEPKEEFESCEDCVHVDKTEFEEPCVHCKHGIPYGDPRHATAPSYFIPEKEVAALKEHNDPVNHPSHYTNGGIECIDEMILVFGEATVACFCLCNVWKYRKRALHKNGEEDLKKADWYMAKYKELIERGRN